MRTVWLGCAVLVAALVPMGSLASETPLERGRYLVEGVVGCGNCHSPRDAEGRLIDDQAYAGRFLVELPPFTSYAPNITSDPETGIGAWSAEDLKRVLREGRRPDGTIVGPPMPIEHYREFSDDDLDAVVTYIRSLKPVRNEVPRSTFRIPLPDSYGPQIASVPQPEASDPIRYGQYLVAIGHCLECHTPSNESGFPDYANRLGAGGFEIPGPWGVSVSANITAHPTEGLARYKDDADVKRIIATGVRPDGTRLLPPMGFEYYGRIREADLDAIVAYLRTLPPQPPMPRS